MPANRTRGDYDQLAQIATRFGREAQMAEQTLRSVREHMNTLEGGDWLGQGARAFYAEMNSAVLPSLTRMVKALQSAQRVTTQISREIKAAEDEAAAILKAPNGSLVAVNGSAATSAAQGTAQVGSKSAKSESGLLSQVGGFFEGIWDGGKGMVEGVVHMVAHPIDTVQGIAYGVTHPSAVWDALKKSYVEDWESGNYGRAIGRGVFEVGMLLVPGLGEAGGATKAAEVANIASKTEKLAEAANLAAKAERLAEAAQVVSKADEVGIAAERAAQVAESVETAAARRALGGRGYLPLENPGEFGTARGITSGRPFFPDEIGLPIEKLSTEGVQITREGIQGVAKHTARFGEDATNAAAVQRLEDIAAGKLAPTQYDVNFYTHELREAERYKALGFETGTPENLDAAHRLWNNTHTATLEDFGLTDADIYHPSLPK